MLTYFWIDLIALGLILLGGIVGMFRGFFATLLSLLGFVGTFIIAYFFSDEILTVSETLFGFRTWIVGLLGASIGGVVAVILAMIVTYILIRVVIFILNHTIGKLFKGRLLGGINSFLGLLLGFVKGALFIAVALITVNVASLIPQVKTWVEEPLSQTYVVGAIYNFLGDQIGDYFSAEIPEEIPEETPEGE